MANLPAKFRILLLPIASMLVGCGANENDPGVGGVTAGEARALNEAAEMLDRRAIGGGAAHGSPAVSGTPDSDNINNSAAR